MSPRIPAAALDVAAQGKPRRISTFILEPEYHSSDDTVKENISVERRMAAMEIQGCAAYALASR